jgi:hypothetical protein
MFRGKFVIESVSLSVEMVNVSLEISVYFYYVLEYHHPLIVAV